MGSFLMPKFDFSCLGRESSFSNHRLVRPLTESTHTLKISNPPAKQAFVTLRGGNAEVILLAGFNPSAVYSPRWNEIDYAFVWIGKL